MMTTIRTEGLRIIGPPRAWSLSDPDAVPGPTTEIQFPVA